MVKAVPKVPVPVTASIWVTVPVLVGADRARNLNRLAGARAVELGLDHQIFDVIARGVNFELVETVGIEVVGGVASRNQRVRAHRKHDVGGVARAKGKYEGRTGRDGAASCAVKTVSAWSEPLGIAGGACGDARPAPHTPAPSSILPRLVENIMVFSKMITTRSTSARRETAPLITKFCRQNLKAKFHQLERN